MFMSAGVQVTQSSLGGGQKILPANARRTGFTIGAGDGGTFTVNFGATTDGTVGFQINPQNSPVTFTVEEHGQWVQQDIWWHPVSANFHVTAQEVALIDQDFDEGDSLYQVGSGNGQAKNAAYS